MVPRAYKKSECFRAFKELLSESHAEAVFKSFVEGTSVGVGTDSADDRYQFVSTIRKMQYMIGKKTKFGKFAIEFPPLTIKGKDYDMRMIDAKEGNPSRCQDLDGVGGEHILCFDMTSDRKRIFSGSSTPMGEILAWDNRTFPKKIQHRLPPVGWTKSSQDGKSPYHNMAVTGLKVIDDKVLLSASLDGTLAVWSSVSSSVDSIASQF